MDESFLDGRVIVKVGDLVREDTDAIVNAANSTLLGGGGVDGAIHDAGGPQILAECRAIRKTKYPDGLPTGKAVITSGGLLPAKHVIHTVGPVYGMNQGQDAELLADCYRNSIGLVEAYGLASVAFPAISTGAFGYPKPEAARIAASIIRKSLADSRGINEVRFVFYSAGDAEIFLRHSKFSTQSR